MQPSQIKYQSFLSIYSKPEGSPDDSPANVTLDKEKNVVTLDNNKKLFKAKFSNIGENWKGEDYYNQIQSTVKNSFTSGQNLAVLGQGWALKAQSILIGNYSKPKGGVVHHFIEELPHLLQEGDKVSLQYLYLSQGSLYDYFKKSTKEGKDHEDIKFGLINNKRTFQEMTEVLFENPSQFLQKLNSVSAIPGTSTTMTAYPSFCIPIHRFVVTRGNKKFSIEFYELPNTQRIARSGSVSTKQLKKMTFQNNCVSAYSTVLRAIVQKNKMVPYKNSFLTKLLKPFFSKNGGNIISLAQIMNSTSFIASNTEVLALNKLLRRCNKAQGLPTFSGESVTEEPALNTTTKAENFFTKHPKFQDMKLQARALLLKAQGINDKIKDLEEGNFEEGGLAFEGLDQPVLNILRNAQSVADVSNEIKNEYFSQLMSKEKEFCESED